MKFTKKTLLITIIMLILFSLSYFFVNSLIGDQKINLNKLPITEEQRQTIKKYFFPHKFYSQKNQTIALLKDEISSLNLPEIELEFKKSLNDIKLEKFNDLVLSNDKTLKRYKIKNGFYTAIFGKRPGGYIDFYQNNLLILSSHGILAYSNDLENELNFRQISNNINDFINLKQFKKNTIKDGISYSFGLRDLFIHKNKIFISYTEEIKEDCWNTSLIYGNMNYEKIVFKKLSFNEKCIHIKNNIDGDFNNASSGGRIQMFDDNNILLSVGCYLERYLAQDKNNINGKIIKINFNNLNYEIVSMGHRNPQGLYYDKENNFILETEHGPMGGDEINLIEISKINKEKPLNYGWAIASAGEHYGGKIKKNDERYRKYPLYKSHTDHGFIEPLKSFVPSVGISQITKIKEKSYIASSMGYNRPGDKSLYFFELDNENKLINLNQIKLFERIRDLIVYENKIYMLLEGSSFKWSATIGSISLN